MGTRVLEIETAPFVAPDLPTIETDYDRFKSRRARFVAALREAGARQVHGALRDGNRVCFVGLGNELLLK